MVDNETMLRNIVRWHILTCIRFHFFRDGTEHAGYYVLPTPGYYVCKLIGVYWDREDGSGPCPIFAACPLQGWKLLVDRRHNVYSNSQLQHIGEQLQTLHIICACRTVTGSLYEKPLAVMRMYLIEAAMLDCGWTLTTPSVQTLVHVQPAWNWNNL